MTRVLYVSCFILRLFFYVPMKATEETLFVFPSFLWDKQREPQHKTRKAFPNALARKILLFPVKFFFCMRHIVEHMLDSLFTLGFGKLFSRMFVRSKA